MDDNELTSEDRVAMFKALAEPTRLRIFEFLRTCCCPVAVDDSGDVRPASGPTVGEVCCQITGADRITSTVSEHLKELKEAGLITIERRGRNMVCSINQTKIDALAGFLASKPEAEQSSECCKS